MEQGLYSRFSAWLDEVLSQEIPAEVVAFCFNLYEGEDGFYVQLIGAPAFDPEDSDWACDEAFSTGEEMFVLPHTQVGEDWERGLAAAVEMVKAYLADGEQAYVLRQAEGVAVGFVEGDLTVIRAQGAA